MAGGREARSRPDFGEVRPRRRGESRGGVRRRQEQPVDGLGGVMGGLKRAGAPVRFGWVNGVGKVPGEMKKLDGVQILVAREWSGGFTCGR